MPRRPPLPLLTLILLAASPVIAQEPGLGRAVVASGNELYVGQPVNWYGPGTVHAYRADGNGQWREAARITASDTARMDDAGRAIATDGNTLVVAAPRKRDGAGVVSVFTRSGAAAPWRQQAILEAPHGGEFGTALALQGGGELARRTPRPAGQTAAGVRSWRSPCPAMPRRPLDVEQRSSSRIPSATSARRAPAS